MAGQKYSINNIIKDREIDLYCRSVEKLLSTISEKNGPKPRKQIYTDEFDLSDDYEDIHEP